MTADEIKARFPRASESFIKANSDAGCVPAGSQQQRNPGNEPVGKDARETADPFRRRVRITSCRRRLCDERNLFDKHFVDSLVEAGILYDDSPQWLAIEVVQTLVKHPADECTLIQVYEDDA